MALGKKRSESTASWKLRKKQEDARRAFARKQGLERNQRARRERYEARVPTFKEFINDFKKPDNSFIDIFISSGFLNSIDRFGTVHYTKVDPRWLKFVNKNQRLVRELFTKTEDILTTAHAWKFDPVNDIFAANIKISTRQGGKYPELPKLYYLAYKKLRALGFSNNDLYQSRIMRRSENWEAHVFIAPSRKPA